MDAPPSLIDTLNEDLVREVLCLLPVHEVLTCGKACKALQMHCEEQLASHILHLSGAAVTDEFLLWLLRRIPRDTLNKLVLSDCTSLTRFGVTRALRRGRVQELDELQALRVGGAAWSVEELNSLIEVCPSIRILHADCRAKGVSADQLGLLAQDQLELCPQKIVVHRARPRRSEEEAELEDAIAIEQAAIGHQPAAVQPAPPAAPAADASSSTDDASSSSSSSSSEYLSPFGAALQRCKGSLKELDARGDVLDEVGVEQVSALLSTSNCALKRLLLAGSSALNDQIVSFSEALATSELEQLQLGCPRFNSSAAATLATALPQNRSLRLLELRHCPLLDAGVTALAEALSSNRALQALNIPFTGVGDRACAALARALRQGSALATLDLAGNSISADGAIELAAALAQAPALTSVSLSANPIGPRGAAAIASALPGSSVTTLGLNGCKVGASPCGRLAAALAGSSVEHIDLGANEIGDQGAWELAWRLPECSALRTMRLAVNEIEEDGASELLSGLAANLLNAPPTAGIVALDLRGNRIPERSHTHAGLAALGRVNLAFQRASYGM